MLTKAVLIVLAQIYLSNAKSSPVEDFPTQLGSYKDPRSSKVHIACEGVEREERFRQADLVFFGKFLSRSRDIKKKVFLDKYKIIRLWKGKGQIQSEVEIEVPPPSDFCTRPRSNLHEGEKKENVGGYVIFAKGNPPFHDCCMEESNNISLSDKKALDRLDAKISEISKKDNNRH